MDNDKAASLRRDIAEGNKARDFLNNKVYNDQREAIEKEMFLAFRRTKTNQSEERDEIWRKMQAMDWLHNRLSRVDSDGKRAASILEKMIKAFKGKA